MTVREPVREVAIGLEGGDVCTVSAVAFEVKGPISIEAVRVMSGSRGRLTLRVGDRVVLDAPAEAYTGYTRLLGGLYLPAGEFVQVHLTEPGDRVYLYARAGESV